MSNPITIPVDNDNYEQKLAYDLVANTNRCLFITGKAGTGKTTFIQRIQKEIQKNFVVLAPTGIAAIAAGGQTVHSFFGFPMEVIGPHTKLQVSFSNEELLKHVDTIIVDEASMLRSDMVDGMDRYLRLAFHNNMPFGGKQIIFVGDLFQLPPVVRKGTVDDEMLCDLYGVGTPFFYKAHVLKRMNLPKIEFKKVYRQTDNTFIEILNKMRVGEVGYAELNILNEQVSSSDDMDDYSVILTGFNKKAERINEVKLNALEGDEVVYDGIKTDEFKPSDCPAPEHLRLKIGAQVIFCRNDYTEKCANGTIAKVINLEDDEIQVQLENGNKVRVVRTTWESYEKVYNRETRRIESKVVGAYSQFPLKLAWAITIHRSQGMTFDRMHFDLSWGTFAAGQAYVAISRMRSLDGLTLSNPLMAHHVTVNPEIKAFSNSFNDVVMIQDELESGKEVYKHIARKQYDQASLALLNMTLSKIQLKDYRNAALLAKQMFDVMLDDDNLIGRTAGFTLIKDCNITCNFLNSVICLYGNKYEEAIGYADLVLSRRNCLEAMYVKARANYELGNWEETSGILFQIMTISTEGEEKRAIDKKLYLLEIKTNDKIGNPNVGLCKKLIKICPSCTRAYSFMRNEIIKKGQKLSGEDIPASELIKNFDNTKLNESDFNSILNDIDMKSDVFREFKKELLKIA